MKKILAVMGAGFLLTIAASASTIIQCTANSPAGPVGGIGGGSQANPTLTGTFFCAGYTAPAGNVSLATLTLTSSYTGPDNPTTFTYTWTPSANYPTPIVITASSAFPNSQSTTFTGTNGVNSSVKDVAATSGLGGATFVAFTVTVNVAGGALLNGNIFTDAFVTYDYATAVPEPATLSIMGAGLLGLGVMLRKRRKA